MTRIQILVAAVAVILLYPTDGLLAQGQTVKFTNSLTSPLTVWIKTEFSPSWNLPPLKMRRGNADIVPNPGTTNFTLGTPGKYYLLFQFPDGNQMDLGWVDINYVVSRDPDVELLVGTRVVNETITVQVPQTSQVEQVYTVNVPYLETVDQQYTVQLADGTTEVKTRQVQVQRIRTEQRTRLVPVMSMVTQQQTREVSKTGLLVKKKGGEIQFIDDYEKKLKEEEASSLGNGNQ